MGKREVPFSRTIYIEKEDFREQANKKVFSIPFAPEVRLKNAYIIKANSVVKDENGEIKGTLFKKGKGHDIDYLLRRLLSVCEQKNYSSKFPAAKVDIDFISKDKDLREIISLLSDFAQGGRYYNLDMVLNGTSKYKDPAEGRDKIVNTIIQRREYLLKELYNGDSDYFYKEINRELIITLEKFARSLARLFTLSDFGDFAKRASPLVFDYLMLMDKDLGTREY